MNILDTMSRRRQYMAIPISCMSELADIPDPYFKAALYDLSEAQVNGRMRYPRPDV